MSDQLFKKNREKTLKREEKERNNRAKILIVCEDEKSSVLYLEHLRKKLNLSATDVLVTGECGSAPISVVDYAIQKSVEGYEYIFCVIDRDSHESFDAAVDKATRWCPPRRRQRHHNILATEIKVIASFPCFEYWLLLHLKDTNAPFTTFDQIKPVLNNELKAHGLPAYDKGSQYNWDIFLNLQLLHLAIARSKRYYEQNQSWSSTQIFQLVEFLQNIKK